MTAQPHTPGPWKACGTIHDHMNSEVRSGFKGEGGPVALVWDDTDSAFANARLIAAAPDLLAACIALQMEARARGCGLRIADEAIAKATTGSSLGTPEGVKPNTPAETGAVGEGGAS